MPNIGFVKPEVSKMSRKWELIRDCVAGEEQVKAKGEKYLPKPQTGGDAIEIKARYDSYKKRAVFYNVTNRTLEGLTGQVFCKPMSIELPLTLSYFENNIDGSGIQLEQQAKMALRDVLSVGRAGLLSDFPKIEEGQDVTKAQVDSGTVRPRIVYYDSEQVINWRTEVLGAETYLSLLVLKESKEIDVDGFEAKFEPRWRVLQCNAQMVQVSVWKEKADAAANEDKYEIDEPTVDIYGTNKKPITRIPFQFIGAENNDPRVDEPPLYSIASLNISHYRNSADLEDSAFLTGQPTPVFSGLTDSWVNDHFKTGIVLGSRSAVPLPAGGDAQLLQADPNNLPLELMRHKEEQMRSLGAKLIEEKKVAETATGAAIEETSEASVLFSAAKNVSMAYTKAVWVASGYMEEVAEDAVSIELNTDFQVAGMNAQERAQLVAEWQGELITWEEAREALRKQGIAYLSDEEAQTQLEAEVAKRGEFREDPQLNGPGQQQV